VNHFISFLLFYRKKEKEKCHVLILKMDYLMSQKGRQSPTLLIVQSVVDDVTKVYISAILHNICGGPTRSLFFMVR